MPAKKPSATKATNMAHIVTMGTTPPGAAVNVVDALAADLKRLKPAHISVLATADSQDNAKRLLKDVGIENAKSRIVILESHQSLDEAVRCTSEEIERLCEIGFDRSRITVDYTAGTKVMACGALLAAVTHEVVELRYLAPTEKGKPSVAIRTEPSAVYANKRLAEAIEFFFQFRFQAAAEAAENVDTVMLSPGAQQSREALRLLGRAFQDLDNFRTAEFLKVYREAAKHIPTTGRMKQLRLDPVVLKGYERVAAAEHMRGEFPLELLIDVFNNAMRRILERRYDDAMSRLYRAAELYAQNILATQYKLYTDDLDIWRIPPRNRSPFEALRRMDDATIKLGLRNSYELLEILGHPVGRAFREDKPFQEVLGARRNLVLAHGTQPCDAKTCHAFLLEIAKLFQLTVPDFKKRARREQLPWINNSEIVESLAAHVLEEAKEQPGLAVEVPEPLKEYPSRAGKTPKTGAKSPSRKAAKPATKKPAVRKAAGKR